jgi:hypothetical protein
VGDLNRGTSSFVRTSRPERNAVDVHEEIADMVHRGADDLTPMDSWGNPRGTESDQPAA